MKYQYFYIRDFISFLHLEKNWRSPSRTFFKTSTFYPIFTILTVSEVCNISSKCWLPNKSATKIFFLHNCFAKHLTLLFHSSKKVVLSIAEGFRKIDFLPHFYLILERMRYAIFQINTDLVKVYEYILIFLHKRLYNLPSFEKFSQNTSLFFP